MNLADAVILGVVEGVTEFLPISSTGHLILTSQLLGINSTEFVKSFEIIIQLGAILAVLILYAKKLISNHNLILKTIIAFIPTGIMGLTLYKAVKTYLLGNSYIVIFALFLGGVVMILIESYFDKKKTNKHGAISEDITISYKQSIVIGLFQSISIIPGVSRAAATIIGGLCVGLDRKSAVEFSFLLAIPTMIAATGLDLLKSSKNFSENEILYLFTGLVISFIVAIISIKWLLRFVQKHSFIPFGIYRIILAIVFFLIFLK